MKVIFAQLFLGIYFVVKGIVQHYSKEPNLFVSEISVQIISKDKLPNYLKKVGKIHIILGIIIATMGQIEYRYNPEPRTFIITYIILGLICISMLFYLNKKYAGNYILRK